MTERDDRVREVAGLIVSALSQAEINGSPYVVQVDGLDSVVIDGEFDILKAARIVLSGPSAHLLAEHLGGD